MKTRKSGRERPQQLESTSNRRTTGRSRRKSGELWLGGENTAEGAAIQRPMFMERKQRSPQAIYGKYNFKK